MKANKITLIIQTIAMYIMHLPLYALLIFMVALKENDLQEPLMKAMFITFLVLTVLIFPICILNYVLSIVSIFKGTYNPSKVVMICKLALIPWYVLNLYICFAFVVSVFGNPFMFIGAPLAITILVCTTYIYMLATSVPDIAFFINQIVRRKIKMRASFVFSLLFLLIFCLDIVGGIMFFAQTKEKRIDSQSL